MALHVKPYPEYDESNASWLRKIPRHWSIGRLKSVVRFAYGDALPNGKRQDGRVKVFGSNGIVGSHVHSNTLGPCLIIGRKGSFGKINYSKSPVFAIDTTYYVDQHLTKADLRWLYHILTWARLDSVSRDSAVPGLDREEAYRQLLPICRPWEQVRMSKFIDTQTSKIYSLIRHKRRLIELLNEQKLAIINHAVTRGLDPNVRMKPSEVDWLGDIPEHWEVSRLKFETSCIVDCLHATPEYTDEGSFPAIRTADVAIGKLNLQKAKRVSQEQYDIWTSRLVPCGGDILYTREGERFGIAATVPDNVQLCISQRMMIFRVKSSVNSNFLMWQLNCRHIYAQASEQIIGAAAPHINIERIKNYKIILPPRNEQEQIDAWITKICNKIDNEIDKIARQIVLLREYRTRLISDVVTGKLDVTGVTFEEGEGEADFLQDFEEDVAETDSDTEIEVMGGLDE